MDETSVEFLNINCSNEDLQTIHILPIYDSRYVNIYYQILKTMWFNFSFICRYNKCFNWMILIVWWVVIFVAHIILSPISIKWRWVFNGVFIRDNPQSLWEIKGRNYLIDVPFIYTSFVKVDYAEKSDENLHDMWFSSYWFQARQ